MKTGHYSVLYLRRARVLAWSIPLLASLILLDPWVGSGAVPAFDFEMVFERHSVVMLLVDPQTGRIVEANDAAARFYGYDRDTLRTMSAHQLNTLTAQQVAEEIKAAATEGRNYFVFRHRLADGEIRTVEIHSYPFEADGQRLLLSIINDLTPSRHLDQAMWHYQQRLEELVEMRTGEVVQRKQQERNLALVALLVFIGVTAALILNLRKRKQAEREINKARDQYHSLVDNIPGVTFRYQCDSCWTLLYISMHVHTLSGYTPEELTQAPCAAYGWLIDSDDQEFVLRAVREAIEKEAQWSIEYRLRHKNGSIRWVYEKGRAVRDEQGKILYLDGFMLDVTERKEAKKALWEYKAMVQQTNDAVALTDLDGKIRNVNKAWARMHGYTADELIGKYLSVFHNSEQMENTVTPLMNKLKEEGSFQDEVVHLRKDGRVFPTHMTSTLLKNEEGFPFGMIVIARDITDEVRQREQAQQEIQFREIILQAAADLLRASNEQAFDVALRKMLTSLGTLFGVDRSYLLRFHHDSMLVSHTHEWCAPKVDAQQAALQSVALNDYSCWLHSLRELRPLHISSIEALVETAGAERKWLQERGIQSLVMVPVADNVGRLAGILGFDAVRSPHYWQGDQIAMLQVLAEVIGSALVRMEATTALAKSNKQLDLFFSQSLTGFFIMMLDEPVDWHGGSDKEALLDYVMEHQHITRVNQALLDQYGAKAEEFIGRTPKHFFADDLLHGREILKGLFEKGRWHMETQERRMDGTLIIVNGDYRCLYDKQGRVTGHFGVQTDVTKRKKAEDALKATNHELQVASEQAEGANIAKSEFLANMSHEIRTPMNGVIGMIDLLMDTDLSEEQRHYADIVKYSGNALLGVISDILDFSKIEARKLELEIIDFDLRRLVDEFIASMSVAASDKGLHLACHVDPEVPVFLRGDPVRVRQLFMNLVANAIKFTSQGRVTMAVERVGVVDESVPLSEEGGGAWTAPERHTCGVRFTITDTGIGIPLTKQNLLFQQFSQVDGSTTREYGGTGLGLAICKQLVTLMGGEIGVRSEPGKGSEFWFVLPFELSSEAYCQSAVSAREEERGVDTIKDFFTRHKAWVLLVEDNPINQQVALFMLLKLGIQADVAMNGEEALAALKRSPYDFVLMDVQMPVLDGLTATRVLRQREETEGTPRVPVVAMTANAMQGDRDHCMDAGMDDYLVKPLVAKELARILEKWLINNGVATRAQAVSSTSSEVIQIHLEDESILDRADLVQRLMGDEELADIVLKEAMSSVPEVLDALENCLQSGDQEGARRHAHSIKGAAANISAEALRAAAEQLERALDQESDRSVDDEVKKLQAAFKDFQGVIGTKSDT